MDRRSFLAAGALASGALAPGARPAAAPAPVTLDDALEAAPAHGFAGWTELARISHAGTRLKVVEDLSRPDGPLAFVAADGRALILGKHLERIAGDPGVVPYFGLDLKTVALADRDLLAERLLAAGGDPDEAAVRRAAPPPGSRFKPEDLGPRLPWTFFLGTRQQADTMPVTTKGSTRTYHIDQVFPELTTNTALVESRLEGLLGGDLPVLVKVFPLGAGRRYEAVVFGDTRAEDRFIVQTWHRTRRVENGRVIKVEYAHSYPAYPPRREPPSAAAFYAALLAAALDWRGELKDMAPLSTPDPSWRDMTRHAFVKEIMTRPGGDYPKYGAVDRDYAGSEYDGFQDTFTSSLYANLEWGRFAQAKAVLVNYFDRFTSPDGMIDMRGPETGQFGLTLMLLARYLRYTGDRATLDANAGKIAATADLLAELHDQALALPTGDPGHGLIHGWNESDSCLFPDPSIWWRPYFANSAFAVRGWREIAAVWPLIRPGEAARAEGWSQRASRLGTRLEQSVRASVRRDLSPPYVPPLPGVSRTFRQSLAQEKPSPQQWPHRAYSELLQADVLPDDLTDLVIATMQDYGATSLGVVANVAPPSPDGRDILGFISYGYARQLLARGRIEDYLLFLYSHRHHAHTAGSWTAGEVSDISGGLPLFCIPAQLTIPLLMRWMLVFEEDDAERLHLARAVPRAWLASGETVAITAAPTRWGRVDLSLRAELEARTLSGQVRLPPHAPETLLHLRAPQGWRLQAVRVDGEPVALPAAHAEALRLPATRSGLLHVEASYGRGGPG